MRMFPPLVVVAWVWSIGVAWAAPAAPTAPPAVTPAPAAAPPAAVDKPAGKPGPSSAAPSSAASSSAAPAPGARAPAAPQQRVAVVRLEFDSGVVEAARELFAQRLAEGLAAAQFDVLAGAQVTQKLAAAGPALARCREPACYPAVSQALAVGYLVAGKVSVSSRTYDITLELINGSAGTVVGTNRERCEICGVEEAGEKMGLAASALRARLEALARGPARFIIRSRPPGAAATLDGQAIGVTPLDRELAGGPHKLTLSAPGFDLMERSFTAVSGVDEVLDLYLVQLPTKFPFRGAGIAGIVTGALLVGAGIWAVSIDGRELSCSDDQRDPGGRCPFVRDSRVLGAVLIGSGVAAATLGGVWLYLGSINGRGNAETARLPGLFARGVF